MQAILAKCYRMRDLHTFLETWGSDVAATSRFDPQYNPSGVADNTTVRWTVRTNGTGAGYLFVNNYERLATLSPKVLSMFFKHRSS